MSNPTLNIADSRPAFSRAPQLAARLLRTVGLTVAAVALVLAGALVLGRRATWQSAFLPAVVVTLCAAAVSLPAVTWCLFGSYYRAVGGWLVGMVLRGLVTAAGTLVAVVVWHRSPLAMLMLVTPLYFAQLAAECVVLVRALKDNA